MVLICLYNLIMNVGRMWGECREECEDECGDQCGDSFTVVIRTWPFVHWEYKYCYLNSQEAISFEYDGAGRKSV